jgi:phosphoribosyl 1,2-cyclic phosphodiesterase
VRFASIGSGSEGNGLVVEADGTRIMIDCGFGLRNTAKRLARINVEPRSLAAILVTHEHSDHADGVGRFAARHGIAVWATFGTLTAVGTSIGTGNVFGFDSHDCFSIGALTVQPFAVPHDAREPVQFVVGDGARRLGVLTDLGMSTPHVRASLSGCDALVLECNHDRALLHGGNYPASLKQRISGRFGHLCNDDSAALLASLDVSKLQHVLAAHLSRENNRPELARQALASALNCAPDWIGIAGQDHGFDWRAFN